MIDETSKQILSKVPKPFDIVDLMARHPVMYEESMNTVLQQEVCVLILFSLDKTFKYAVSKTFQI